MNVTEIRRPADMERINTPELAQAFIDEQIALIKEQVGDKKVLLALSGGVDSSVVAALLIKAIGQQLVCVHVNHGLLRKGEPEQVIEVFRNQMNANLVYVDATDRFLDKLAGVDDPETKRKIIGGEFIEVFAEEARKLDGIEFLAQGTIWPDILESEMCADAEKEGYWTLQSTVLQDNTASRALHTKCGFRLVGRRERIARDCHGRWLDTYLMERRAKADEPEGIKKL